MLLTRVRIVAVLLGVSASAGGDPTRPISVLATDGASTEWPAYAARTARISSSRGASLSRYPVAPASIAGSTSRSVSYVVRISTRAGCPSCRSRRRTPS